MPGQPLGTNEAMEDGGAEGPGRASSLEVQHVFMSPSGKKVPSPRSRKNTMPGRE